MERNTAAYQLLFELEIGMRELVTEELCKAYGHRWWRRGVPPDVRRECVENCQAERSIVGLEHYPHTFLYYSTFGSLRKIIEGRANWDNVFSHIFRNKLLISIHLAEVDHLRNKVAHNRLISEADLTRLRTYVEQIRRIVGEQRFASYQTTLTALPNIGEVLEAKLAAYRTALRCVLCAEPVPSSGREDPLANSWWFEEEILGRDLSPMVEADSAISMYQGLPRGWGAGPVIQRAVEEQGIRKRIEAGIVVLESAVRTWRSV